MPYLIHDLDIADPLPDLTLSPTETGVALIVRRQGRPIGFLMKPVSPGSTVPAGHLNAWIGQELGPKILREQMREPLQERLRDRLSDSPPAPPFPSLTLAICTKDRPDNLSRCLSSLLPLQTGEGSEPPRFEVLVVDNAPSDDRTRDCVAALPTVRYVREPKPGLDFARNRAIAHATGDLLAYLDDDVTVDAHWLEGLQAAWAENPDAAAFTGLVLPYELATEAQLLFEQRGGFRRGFEQIRYGKILPGNPLYPCGAGIFGAGCNMAFRREVLLQLGGFDEALDTGKPLPGGGDLDIFYRVVRAGHPLVYDPRYLVFHQHRRDLPKLRHQYWTWGLGFMAFVTKSYRHDPEQRSQLRRLIRWWFGDQLQQVKQRLRQRHPLPLAMILSELGGGIVGLLGEYGRSQARIQQIRRQQP